MGMKGISTVIATLLMLVITIGLAGMAYVYISGIFGRSTQTISLVDAYCVGGNATWIVRNEGTTDITAGSISGVPINENCTTDPSWGSISITAGSTATITATNCSSGRVHVYRMRGPSNAIELAISC